MQGEAPGDGGRGEPAGSLGLSPTGGLLVLAAAAAGFAATEIAPGPAVRLALAAAALGVLLVSSGPHRPWASRSFQTWLLAAVTAATLTHAVGEDLWKYATSPWIRTWNVFHYYLGAEYFEELGYFHLYDAALRADREGKDRWRKVRRVRNLRTYEVEARIFAEDRFEPLEHFSPQRWQEFRRDVSALQKHLSSRQWRSVFVDRGFNPPPFWTFVGQHLTGLLPARSPVRLKILTSLDLLLLTLTFLLMGRTFGVRKALLVLLFLTLSPVNTGRFIGGFLQYDWFCAIAAGVCWLRRGKAVGAAAALAYATMSRAFPVLLVASLIPAVVLFWIRSGRIRRPDLRFGLAFGLFCLLALGLGSLTGRGPHAWLEFAGNITHHSQEHTFGERRVGLKHVFTHDLGSFAFDETAQERRRVFARQSALYRGLSITGLLVFATVALFRRREKALVLGLIPLFLLTASSRYYWSCLALVPLAGLGESEGRRRRLDLAQAGVFLGYYLFALLRPERFAAYSFFNLLLCLYFVFLLAGEVRRLRGIARAAKAPAQG